MSSLLHYFSRNSKVQHLGISILFLWASAGHAQDSYYKNEAIDIQSYIFNLSLNDQNNRIEGEAIITIEIEDQIEIIPLDLIGRSGRYGMEVTGVYEGEVESVFEHSNNKIRITPTSNGLDVRTFKILYSGIPQKGLVIDTTKFGERSFFGDNWPNLARHWLPCVDHPYDKASVTFNITAPDHYDVVATGKKIEESNLDNGYKLTRYHEAVPVAMKVVTIGVTKFATKLLGTVDGIPITAWVYPENRLEGFSDYAIAVDVLKYFSQRIGPYPYGKLANMQAKTQWGGLENAGTISYFENSVTGKNTVEGLIAHEVAHQWFGNSATEDSWNHVWLSEGFATYFTILYQEHKYGDERRRKELVVDRKQVIDYYKKNPSPVVDYKITNPMKVLSTNTYQKGSWVLNMLRHKVGEDAFWEGIRNYYKTYKNDNALTVDFRRIMEEVSGQKLQHFFDQWIFRKGYPEIAYHWKYQEGKLMITIDQTQKHPAFTFPLDLGLIINGEMRIETVEMDDRSETFEINVNEKPEAILLDPNCWLLFEKDKD